MCLVQHGKYTCELDLTQYTFRISDGQNTVTELLVSPALPLFVCAGSTLSQACVKLESFSGVDGSSKPKVPKPVLVDVHPLPSFLRFGVHAVSEVIRQLVLRVDEALLQELARVANDISADLGLALRFAPTAAAAGGAGRAVDSALLSSPAICDATRVVGALSAHTAVTEYMRSAFVTRARVLFELHGQVCQKLMSTGSLRYVLCTFALSKFQDVLVSVGEGVFGLSGAVLEGLLAGLRSAASSLVTSMFGAQIRMLKDTLKRYVMTPSVLSTFSPDFIEMRAVLQYVVGMVRSGDAADEVLGGMRSQLCAVWSETLDDVISEKLANAINMSRFVGRFACATRVVSYPQCVIWRVQWSCRSAIHQRLPRPPG